MQLPAGSRLDSYEIIAPLGAGGMGEVYRARDPALKRDVAIKVLPADWSRDPERLHRFELEAQAAAALNHPNIVSIFHVGQHDGCPYIVTELLQGETLRIACVAVRCDRGRPAIAASTLLVDWPPRTMRALCIVTSNRKTCF